MKKITIRDVAKEAGVSVTLVSFVMNAKRDENGELDCCVNKDTAKRVLEVAKRLGYRRNQAAASLRSGRSSTIAVIVTDIANPFYAEICRYIENVAYKSGYTVLFASTDEKTDKLRKIINTIIGYNVEGLIVAPSTGSERMLKSLQESNVPIVLIDRNIEGEEFGRVLVDNNGSGRLAAQHLIDKGHKKIEMISYSLGVTSFTNRETGYEECMKENGLGDNAKVHLVSYEKMKEEVLDIVKDAHKRGVEAFILSTKSIALSGFNAFNELDFKYPDDFDLVCFDESDIYELNNPSVPHIIQPLEEIGKMSFEMLEKMIEGKAEKEDLVELLPAKFCQE